MAAESVFTILAVDDEIYNLESLQRTLRGEYRVLTTTSPSEALQLFQSEPVQLIIADQRMPEMTGTELLERMKQISPHPIRMVLSAYTDIEYLIDAINRGEVYRYITKPWEPNELRVIIKNALEFYQSEQERRELIRQLEKKNQELIRQNKALAEALRQLEDAQKKLVEMERYSMIGKMAGMIIHDLKQPLDIIRSAADTMARMELEADERIEIADMIKYEVQRFLELIHELLEYSRGTFTLDMEEIMLSDFIVVMENRLKNFLKNFPVDVRFVSTQKDARVRLDRHRFQRALMNLVKNAVESFSLTKTDRSPRITVETRVDDNVVVFSVKDNGPGIPEELQQDIFKPFVSGKKVYGIGLGLAIVKRIVDEHNGDIRFSSSPEDGTTFTIRLPKISGKAVSTNAIRH